MLDYVFNSKQMNIFTRLTLNIPIFVGGLAGIAMAYGHPLTGWLFFIAGAILQANLFASRDL